MPLPPLGVDTYRRWAADRWKDVTDATIGRVQSGLWDVQASSAIDALGQQLARMREQQAQAQAQERQRQEAVRAQLEEDQRRREEDAAERRAALSSTVGGAVGGFRERLGAGFSSLGGAAQRGAQGLQGAATDWSSRADAAIDGLGGVVGLTAPDTSAMSDEAFGRARLGQGTVFTPGEPLPIGQEPVAGALPTPLPGVQGLAQGIGAYASGVVESAGRLGGLATAEGPRNDLLASLTRVGQGIGVGATPTGVDVPLAGGREVEALEARRRAQAAATPQDVLNLVQPGLDVANLWPTPLEQGANLAFSVASEGAKSLGVPEPVAAGLGLVAGTGLPGVGARALTEGLPYAFRRGGDLLGDLARRYGTPADGALGIVNAKTYDPTGINPVQGRLAARGAPGRAPGPAMLGPVTPAEAAKIRSGRYGAAYEGPPLSSEPIPPGPGPNGEYTIRHPHGYDMVAPPPAPNTYLSSDGYLFWQRVAAGLSPYRADYERSVRELAQPKYPWDPLTSPPPAPGTPGYGRIDLSPLPAPDWDTRLAGWVPRNQTDPQTLRHLLNRYAMHERFPREAVDDLAPSHPDLATPEARAAAEADLNEALTQARARRSKNEDRAITSERNTRRAPGEAPEEGAADTGDGTYSYTSTKGVAPDGGREFHFTSSYEVATAIKLDLAPTVASWQKGSGPRGRVRLVIDPKYGYDPTNESLMRNSDPGPGSEVIYSPDFLATFTDDSQKVIETKNVGIYDLPAWRIEAKTTAGQRHFEDLWGVGFMMMAEDQLGRPFLRELATADVARLPAGHPLRRVRPGDLADLQKKLLSAAKASRGTKVVADDARLMGAAQHLMDLNASSRYPASADLDDTRTVQQYLSAARAQAEWHNTLPGEGTTFSVDGQSIPLAPGLGGYMVSVTPASARISYPGHRIHEYRLAQFRHENQRWFDMLPDARVGTFKWTDDQGRTFTDLDISIRAPDGVSAAQIANLFRQRAVYNIDRRTVDAVRPRNWVGTREFGEREAFEQLRQLLEAATTRALGGTRDAGVFPDVRHLGLPVAPGPIGGGAGRGRPDRAAARRGAGVPGLLGADAGGPEGAGVLGAVGRDQPTAGAGLRPPTPPELPPDQGGSPALGGAGAAGIAAQPGGGPGLGAAFRGAVDALAPAGAAVTRGQRAFDLTTGTLGGAAPAGTAEEDATWQERAGRFALGSAAGALVGPTGRSALGAIGRDAGERGVLGIAPGRAPAGGWQHPAGAVQEAPAQPGVTKLGAVTQTLQAAPLIAPSSQFWNNVSGALRTGQRFWYDTFGNVDRLDPRNPLGARETLADFLGMGAAVPDALRALGGEFGGVSRTGGRGQGVAAGGLTSSKNPWARLVTVGTRGNTGGDMFWRTLNEGGARLAARLGVDPQDLDPNDVVQVTNRAGDFSSFVGPNSFVADGLVELGKIANDRTRSKKARGGAALLASFAPYVRMPERIMSATAQLITDPVTQSIAFKRALSRGDEYARREAQGRLTLAVPLVATFVHDYFSGDLRGDPPVNPTERRRQEAQGAKWNTWRGVPIPRMGPPGQAAAAVATALAAGERAVLRDEHAADVGRDVVNAVGRWALSNSYLDDLTDFFSEVGEGRFAEAAEKQAVNVASRPLSWAAGAAGAFDPYERTREGTGEEALYRAVPGGRFALPERLDPASGQPVRRKGSPVQRYLLGSQGVEQSPEGQELNRYGVSAPTFRAGSEYGGAPQTGAQARALQRASGSEVNREVRALMASPDYQKATEEQKPALLRAAVARGRAAADIVVGEQVARDPKAQATAAWQAVPKYRGVEGTPEEVRRLNTRISRAKAARAAAARKGREAESAWVEAHPEEYELSRYREADARGLRLEREQIEQQYGVDLS